MTILKTLANDRDLMRKIDNKDIYQAYNFLEEEFIVLITKL